MFTKEKPIEEGNKSFVERIANQLGITANAKYIYAEPVERNGVTVIPVAKAAYGFGGGSGKKEGEEGSGGGGGVAITPVGYIEMKNGETRFRQIIDSAALVSLMTIGSLSLLTAFWGVSKILHFREGRSQ